MVRIWKVSICNTVNSFRPKILVNILVNTHLPQRGAPKQFLMEQYMYFRRIWETSYSQAVRS